MQLIFNRDISVSVYDVFKWLGHDQIADIATVCVIIQAGFETFHLSPSQVKAKRRMRKLDDSFSENSASEEETVSPAR
jgi:hypothetical protein